MVQRQLAAPTLGLTSLFEAIRPTVVLLIVIETQRGSFVQSVCYKKGQQERLSHWAK